MVGCDKSIAQTIQSHGSYGSVPIWTSHAGNQLGTDVICPAVVDCDQMPQECTMKMTDLLVTTMTLMMNAWHLLRMKVNKIEGPFTHAVNAQINTI